MLSEEETVLPVVDNDRVVGVIRLEEIFIYHNQPVQTVVM